MAAEMKLLVASPSVKSWPLALASGALLILTGAAGFALQALSLNAALLTAAAGMALTVVPALAAANTEYYVTNARVVARRGVFRKSEESIPLDAVVELRLKTSAVQRALGIGDLEVAGEGRSVTLYGLEDPEQARDRILALGR